MELTIHDSLRGTERGGLHHLVSDSSVALLKLQICRWNMTRVT